MLEKTRFVAPISAPNELGNFCWGIWIPRTLRIAASEPLNRRSGEKYTPIWCRYQATLDGKNWCNFENMSRQAGSCNTPYFLFERPNSNYNEKAMFVGFGSARSILNRARPDPLARPCSLWTPFLSHPHVEKMRLTKSLQLSQSQWYPLFICYIAIVQ